MNEIDVISTTDYTVRARVPAPQPWGIDQMPDGKTLVVGTSAQAILTVDEGTLTVTQHPVPFLSGPTYGLLYPNVVALANGRVLIIGQEQGIESNNILDGGQYLLKWNSNTDLFSILEPKGQLSFEVDRIAHSADRKWAFFLADQFYFYSSDADTVTTVPFDSVSFGLAYSGAVPALSPDGSEIALARGDSIQFADRSLNPLGNVIFGFTS